MSNPTSDHNINSGPARRLTTETKASTKTTEFYVYIVVVIAIIITSAVAGGNNEEGNGGADVFDSARAMMYITWATIGYMVSRGLAKSGSRDRYDEK
ncbi:hypothetical protein LWF01_03475 [Saxibacter everestensis]|uniref:Uncharacterized protein n=1 Tax=Saxibacter everestensis TaxID=2909229 RepID=A0ABY8QV00_9MICO|nr:hypothetical protein LWF01_03475 [Brevibacteriaceae bacterium ZFBP1038]